MTYGEVLAYIIKERGITMTALSKDSGVPLTTISGLVNGYVKEPTFTNASHISESLGVSMEAIWEMMQHD